MQVAKYGKHQGGSSTRWVLLLLGIWTHQDLLFKGCLPGFPIKKGLKHIRPEKEGCWEMFSIISVAVCVGMCRPSRIATTDAQAVEYVFAWHCFCVGIYSEGCFFDTQWLYTVYKKTQDLQLKESKSECGFHDFLHPAFADKSGGVVVPKGPCGPKVPSWSIGLSS